MSNHQSGYAALVRRLRKVLSDSPDDWLAFARFARTLKGRYDGQDMSKLTLQELETLSRYADLSRQEAPSNGYNVDNHCYEEEHSWH